MDKLYIIKGNIVNYHTPTLNNATEKLIKFTQNTNLELNTDILFNRHWRETCQKIRDDKNYLGFNRVIMVAHSWGVSAAFSIANCIKQETGKNVDLIISIDPIYKPFSQSASSVPSSVKKVISYYQKDDFFLKGISTLRSKSSSTSIAQNQIYLPQRFNAHDEIVKVLVETNKLQDHILDAITNRL